MTKLTPFGLFFIALTVLFTVLGQLAVKKGMLEVGVSPSQFSLLPRFVWQAVTNVQVLFGMGCAVVAALAWTVAISRSDLNVAYPFVTLGTVLVLVLSGLVFGEAVPLNRWIGVLIVCAGLIVAAQG